jgi:phytoene desaturase
VVIGGGLGGLATAVRLAARGWRVSICERGPTVGGKMNSWTRDGFRFDTGPSLITMPWIFEETFAAAGARFDDHVELVRMNPIAEYHFADGTHLRYSSALPELLETVRSLEPRDEKGFLRFLEVGARVFELSQGTFFRRSPTDPPDATALRAMRHLPLRHAWRNYHRTVASLVRSPHLRQLLGRYPTYVGSSPYQAPATLAVIPYIELAFGGHYVVGGLYRIVDGLRSIAERLGVEIHCNAEVTRIESRDGRAHAVHTADGIRHEADVVIMNGDASMTDVLLGRTARSTMAETERSMSGLVFLVGIRRRLDALAHHTVYFSSDYETEFSNIFDERRFPDEPTVYVNAPSRTDGSTAPDGCESLFVMANAPANDFDRWDGAAVSIARERVFARLRRSGFPEIERDIVVEDVWTPGRIATRYGMPGGAIYGVHSHGWRNAFMRPANRDRTTRGLYHVGGSTHPGGGTPTVLMSARITSELIQRDEMA